MAWGRAEREDLSPVEIVAAGKKIAELIGPAKRGRPKKDEGNGGKFPPLPSGKVRDQIGSALGVSGRTFAKIQEAAAIVAANPERDENTCRESLKPAEMVEIGRKLEALEKPKAQQRERAGKKAEPSGKLPEGSKGDTRDKVAKALGTSGRTYEKAKAVAKAAEIEPDKFGRKVNKLGSDESSEPNHTLDASTRSVTSPNTSGESPEVFSHTLDASTRPVTVRWGHCPHLLLKQPHPRRLNPPCHAGFRSVTPAPRSHTLDASTRPVT